MRARILAVASAALFFAGCGDSGFGPAEDPITERIAPSVADAHLTESFRISPVALDFGQVPVGTTSAEQLVVITHVGEDGAVVMSGAMAGADGGSDAFAVAEDCQGVTLAGGASCVMRYSFTPTAAGAIETAATGTWNGQPFTIALRGEGMPTDRLSITGTALDFGQVDVGASAAPQTVTVTNLGPGPILMSGTGGGAASFTSTDNCQGVTLAEGASCEMTYSFTATAGGIAQETVTGSWNGQSYSIDLRGEGMQQRRFAITQTAFDFGEVSVGGFSSMEVVNVTNLGPGPIVMNGVQGTTSAFLFSEWCHGVMLGEGQSCQMYFAFMPSAAGEVVETLAGTWNGQPYSIRLRGVGLPSGTPMSKRFLISTRGLDFGQVPVGGASTPFSILVVNQGPDAVVMSGNVADGGAFSGTSTCAGVTLQPGGFCEMTYRFTPTTGGQATFTATGAWNGEEYSIALSGYGMQRQRFLITPTAHDFGSVTVGASSAVHTMRVTNVGPGSIVMNGTGGVAADFGGTQNCQGATLAEGASCLMSYRFEPTTSGEIVRTASGTWNGQAYSFTFRGFGVERERFLISPVGFDFGEVELGRSAPEQSVTITNRGPGAVTMNGSVGTAALFAGTEDCQGVTLAEGASCSMSYSFSPAAAGAVTATASGAWNGQSFELSFRGVGIPPLSADIRFGGFLPPFNKRPKVLPGMTVPVKAQLLNEMDMPLPDADAARMADACEVVVVLSADPDTPLCARYDATERHFIVNLRIPRLIPLGLHRVSMLVRVNGALIAVGEADIEVRGR